MAKIKVFDNGQVEVVTIQAGEETTDRLDIEVIIAAVIEKKDLEIVELKAEIERLDREAHPVKQGLKRKRDRK
jgi:hypothetical protein